MNLYNIIECFLYYLKYLRQKYCLDALTEMKTSSVFNCLFKNHTRHEHFLVSRISRIEHIVVETLIKKLCKFVPENNRNIVSKELKKIILLLRVNSYFFQKKNNMYDLQERANIIEICVRHKLFDNTRQQQKSDEDFEYVL